jgi:hypothetical protein
MISFVFFNIACNVSGQKSSQNQIGSFSNGTVLILIKNCKLIDFTLTFTAEIHLVIWIRLAV